MISDETVERIWKCKREIAVGTKLLEEMKEISENMKRDGAAERIRDAFGRERDLELGIPSGKNCHRLISVSPALSVSIITTHIANKMAELIEANEQAKLELGIAPQDKGAN